MPELGPAVGMLPVWADAMVSAVYATGPASAPTPARTATRPSAVRRDERPATSTPTAAARPATSTSQRRAEYHAGVRSSSAKAQTDVTTRVAAATRRAHRCCRASHS